MKKKEFKERYGKAAYEKMRARTGERFKANPEKAEEHNHEINRKGGKFYERTLENNRTGLRGERNKIRSKHGQKYRPYKDIIAPDSQIHHQWVPGTSDYDGVALVEKDQHMRGFVDVIRILEGDITVFTEEELRNHGDQIDK